MTQTQALRKENTTPVSLLSSKGRSRAAPVFRNGPRRFCYLPVLFDTTSQTGGRSTGLRLAPHMGIAPLRGSLRAAPSKKRRKYHYTRHLHRRKQPHHTAVIALRRSLVPFREVLASEAVLLRRSGKIRSTELFSFQGTVKEVLLPLHFTK